MPRLQFILAFLILILACVLQAWFASVNIFIDFVLASLISFAFFFDIWELLIFILFGVFIINWQPAISLEVVLFIIIPLLAYTSRKLFALIPWVALPVAVIVGVLVFYAIVAPTLFFASWMVLFLDVLGGAIFGECIFFALSRHNAYR